MSNPSEGAMIITFVLIYFLVLFGYKWISDHIVAVRERYIDSGTLLESQQQILGSFLHLSSPPPSPLLVSPSAESEGDQYKKALIFLSERKTEYRSVRINPQSGRRSMFSLVDQPENVRRQIILARWRDFIHSPAFRQHVKLMKEREKNLINKITGSFQFQPISNPLTLTFDHLYYTLHSNGVSILKDIYGQFLPYNITALMGSSGAGKTTLLSLLRGKTYSGTISGEIYVNKDKVGSLAPFSNCMGFVPQDDIMYDELTVSENLKYAAMLFNRRGYVNIPEVLPMVHHTMELLGLSFIKHSVVGRESPLILLSTLTSSSSLSQARLLLKESPVARRSVSTSAWSS
jgi:ABC-type multidrug transport system fused ATPase/permease subunit